MGKKKLFSWLTCCVCVVTLFILSALRVQAQRNDFVLVIDAGHGGKDYGACHNGINEKDLNLAVALRTGAIIKARYPKVKVLYTRSTDTFVGLMERANFANRNKANLFISVHTNSAENSSANGTETYVLGLWRSKDNLRVAMRENQSITLEANYKTTYRGFDPSSAESYIIFELMQNQHMDQSIDLARRVQSNLAKLPLTNRGVRQAGFLVIREIAMPGILIEIGFVSNNNEARYLSSTKGQQELSNAIADGFAGYYASWLKKAGKPAEVQPKATPNEEITTEETEETYEEQTEPVAQEESNIAPDKPQVSRSKGKSKTLYRIQIAASKEKKNPSRDAFFSGLSVRTEQKGRVYCYTVEETASLKEAQSLLRKHKKRFKDAFIVEYQNGKRSKEYY